MRDYADIVSQVRIAAIGVKKPSKRLTLMQDAADAIEELLAFARSVARRAVDAQDDEVSAEVLCRKLYKLGIIEKDGAWWHYEPPKEVNDEV